MTTRTERMTVGEFRRRWMLASDFLVNRFGLLSDDVLLDVEVRSTFVGRFFERVSVVL